MSLKHISLLLLFAMGVVAGVAGVGFSQDDEELEDVRQGPRPVDPREHRICQLIEDVEFTDIEGKQGKLSDYKDKTLVILITNKSCPVCKRFAPVVNEIVEDYADQEVAFLMLNPMEHETIDDCKDAVKRYGFKARYISDPKGILAQALAVNSTGDAFVLDRARTLRYRGAISDQFGLGYNLDEPRETYLRDAINAVVSGGEVVVPATWAPG